MSDVRGGHFKAIARHPFSLFLLFLLIGFVSTAFFLSGLDSYCVNVEQKAAIHQDSAKQKSGDPRHPITADQTSISDQTENKANSDSGKSTDIRAESWGKSFLCETKLSDVAIIFFTYCLVIVGGFQAWWLYGTLRATAKAADTAERALVDLERPFVFAEITKPGFTFGLKPHPQAAQGYGPIPCVDLDILEVTFLNLGRSPALLKRVEFDIRPAEYGSIADPIDPSKIGGRDLPVGIVSFGDKSHRETDSLYGRFFWAGHT